MIVKKTNFITSATKKSQYPEPTFNEVVLLGRSNVGKSTFINSFTNNKKLAYISSKPGKTQVINFFLINDDFILVDVPGYGYAKVSKKQREAFGKMIEEYLTLRPTLKFAILLIDFKVGPTEDDILMYEFLQYFSIKTLIVATKEDKVKKTLRQKQFNNIKSMFLNNDNTEILTYSKDNKDSIKQVTNKIFELLN